MLVPVALVFGVLAAALARARQRFDAQAYALVAALAGLASIGLVTWHGFGIAGDPARATWVYAVFALAAPLFGCWFAWHPLVEGTGGRAETRGLAWLGSGLLLAALVQGLAYGGLPIRPACPGSSPLLAHATLTTGAGLALIAAARRGAAIGPDDADFAPSGRAGSRRARSVARSSTARRWRRLARGVRPGHRRARRRRRGDWRPTASGWP